MQNLKKDKVLNSDKTASQENAWKETCNVPSGWMVKEDKQNPKVSNDDKTPSLEDGWKESCKIPSGWMGKEDQQNLEKDKVSKGDESYSLEDCLDKTIELNWEEEQCQCQRKRLSWKK